VLAASDVILFSSRVEGLPLALLEGMAAGCIPIVTRISGMPEAVNDPSVGWVVEPESPEAIAVAMTAVLALDAAALASMKANARKRVQESFDIEKSHAVLFTACGL
jgi:glycosyltransferase involved in cell wall biosynthesis